MAKAKIMVVDDNPFICELMQSRLEANGYKVIIAFDGEEALGKAKKEHPDLILLDVTMPGINGFEVAGKLKENPKTEDIAVVMVTAHGEHDTVMKALSTADIAGYVLKPFKPEDLLSAIEDALKKRS